MKTKITIAIIFSIVIGLCLYAAIGLVVSIAIQGNGFNIFEWELYGVLGFAVLEAYVVTTCFMTILE